ncbi:MAG: polymer-forming cytoskeletal protein [Burkholderiales bacterium]
MLRSDSLFGKRDSNTLNPALSTTSAPGGTLGQTGVTRQFSPTSAAPTDIPKATPPDSPKVTPPELPKAVPAAAPATDAAGSRLIVGPNIKLKGVEITDCDTIVIEGFVEAKIFSRVIQIAQQGAFKGSAEIDIAEIRGEFDGELTVRQKLVIFSTGKVSGKIHYGKLVVEEGGQLSGDVQMDGAASPKALIPDSNSAD